MKPKSLLETNPYLKDPALRKRLVARSVRTSCGVEGIKPKNDKSNNIEIKHRRAKKIDDVAIVI